MTSSSPPASTPTGLRIDPKKFTHSSSQPGTTLLLAATIALVPPEVRIFDLPSSVSEARTAAPPDAEQQSVQEDMATILSFSGSQYPSGYGAPASEWAVNGARAVLRDLAAIGLRPERLVPMADGGVSLWFSREGRFARIEITNDEEVVVTTIASEEDAPVYADTTTAAAATLIADAINV